jgi:hypothetical protein
MKKIKNKNKTQKKEEKNSAGISLPNNGSQDNFHPGLFNFNNNLKSQHLLANYKNKHI